jgi:thiamine-phosphate pyrophosphorylase
VLVNSRSDVALAVGAAGVHLPENDIPVAAVRSLLTSLLIGRSAHSLEVAQDAERDGADYVVFGPVFPTPSHDFSTQAGQGLPALARVAAELSIPVVAIGGIDQARRIACEEAGAAGFAAIRYWI